MRTYYTAQGILSALWWPKCEGNLKKSGYMYTHDWHCCTARNQHNIVKQLYSKYLNYCT